MSQLVGQFQSYQTFRGVPDANILELELRKGALGRIVAHVAHASSENGSILDVIRLFKVRGRHLHNGALLLDESRES